MTSAGVTVVLGFPRPRRRVSRISAHNRNSGITFNGMGRDRFGQIPKCCPCTRNTLLPIYPAAQVAFPKEVVRFRDYEGRSRECCTRSPSVAAGLALRATGNDSGGTVHTAPPAINGLWTAEWSPCQ